MTEALANDSRRLSVKWVSWLFTQSPGTAYGLAIGPLQIGICFIVRIFLGVRIECQAAAHTVEVLAR